MGYNRLAWRYEKTIRTNISNYDQILDKAAEQVRNKKNVLDYGAGAGDLAVKICQKNPKARITAIDASEKMLALARRKLRVWGLEKQVKLVVADHVIGKKFDAITSTFVIYLLDRRKIINAFSKHMKRGGVLVLTDVCYKNFLGRIGALAVNTVQIIAEMPLAKFCALDSLKTVLEESGFKQIKISKVGKLLWLPVYLITAVKR